jgi:hypothetical protein
MTEVATCDVMVNLPENAINICKNFMKAQYKLKSKAIELRDILIRSGAMSCDDTYEDVLNRFDLQRTIKLHLINGLSQSPAESKYGLKIISDFHLVYACSTDRFFREYLKVNNIKLDAEQYTEPDEDGSHAPR